MIACSFLAASYSAFSDKSPNALASFNADMTSGLFSNFKYLIPLLIYLNLLELSILLLYLTYYHLIISQDFKNNTTK